MSHHCGRMITVIKLNLRMQLVAEVFIKSVRFGLVSLRKQLIIIYCYKSSFFLQTHKVTVMDVTLHRNFTGELLAR